MKQQYDSYKPSGIDWIGEIPSHWVKCRFKNFLYLKAKPSCSNVKIGLENLESGSGKFIESDTEFEGNGIEFCYNDILYGKLRPYLRKVWLAEFSGNAVGDFFVFGNSPNSAASYLKYLLLSDGFTKQADGSTFGAKMPRVSSEFILTLPYYLPPINEQEEIAAWLDEKCEEIDAAIAKVDREIELIDELKQSEISRAVTRGLNPKAPLRPSGIDWINEIPFNWSSMKLKHTVKNIETDFMDGDWIESNDIATEGIRYLTSGNIGAGVYKEQGEGFITEETFAKLDCIEVFPGDLLISRLNEPIARTCFIPTLGYRIVTCVDNVIYRPKSGQFDKRYMMYQFNSKPFWFNASQLSSGATMQRISRSKLRAIKVIVPPLSEQQAIADYLDKKCAEIDGLKAKLTKKRETLTELRQSIISEIVTGKRKVI